MIWIRLGNKERNGFEKDVLSGWINAVFGKVIENVKKHRDIKLFNRKKKKLFGVRAKLSYYKVFPRKFICNRKEKNRDNGLSILELSKVLTYEFWYDFVNPKYGEKAKLYDVGTDRFQNMVKKHNCIIWVQTGSKIWWKSTIVLDGYA